MFGHLPELVIIMVIALIVFGPEKLPEAAASAGKMIREVKQALDGAMNPHDEPAGDDFSTYYYESLARSGEDASESPSEEEAAEVWPHPTGAAAGTEAIESSLPEVDPWAEVSNVEPEAPIAMPIANAVDHSEGPGSAEKPTIN